jgi:hypothetical protein
MRRKSLHSICATGFQPCGPLNRRCDTLAGRCETLARRYETRTRRFAALPERCEPKTIDCASQESFREAGSFVRESRNSTWQIHFFVCKSRTRTARGGRTDVIGDRGFGIGGDLCVKGICASSSAARRPVSRRGSSARAVHRSATPFKTSVNVAHRPARRVRSSVSRVPASARFDSASANATGPDVIRDGDLGLVGICLRASEGFGRLSNETLPDRVESPRRQ